MANAEYTGSNAQQSSSESPIELNVHHVEHGPIHVICYLKAGLPLRRETSGARRTARPHPRSPAPAVQLYGRRLKSRSAILVSEILTFGVRD
jgi:hypothetical protein